MKSRPFQFLASLLCCLWLAACTPAPEKPLRVGTNLWIGYEPLYLAREINVLDQDKIRLVEYTSTIPVLNAFRNDLLDAAALTLDEALLLQQKVTDISVVLVLDISNGADALLSQTNIQSVAQLKGQTVAVENLATGGYLLSRALQIAGLQQSELTIVTAQADVHESMLQAKRVAAVVTYDPQKSRILANGANKLFDSSNIPGEIVDVLVVRNKVLHERPQSIRHLTKAWFIAREYLRRNPRDSLAKMQARQHLNATQLQNALQQLIFPGQEENRLLLSQADQLATTLPRLQQYLRANKLLASSTQHTLKLDPRWVAGL